MFTGIVEEIGEVVAVEGAAGGGAETGAASGADSAVLTIRGPAVTADVAHGASICVSGVCLTVLDSTDGAFRADVMRETLLRSNLGALAPGSRVNLERALPATGRLDGHLVQGHVDGTGTLLERRPGAHWESLTFSLPDDLARYVVEKGSIAVDGVSLTVTATDGASFSVGLIPTTLRRSTLGSIRVGDPVNLEVDVLAKYVERLLKGRAE